MASPLKAVATAEDDQAWESLDAAPVAADISQAAWLQYVVAFYATAVTSYVFHSVKGLSHVYVAMYFVVCACSAVLLSYAYSEMFETQVSKYAKTTVAPPVGGKRRTTEESAALDAKLRQAKYGAAQGYSFGVCTAAYAILSLLLLLLFKSFDSRLAYVVAQLVSSAAVWYLAYENRDVVKQKQKKARRGLVARRAP